MDHINWIFLPSNVTTYVFDGLSPSTNYLFYAKAIDNKNIPSDEMNISVRTLDLPPPIQPPSGGGGGGGGSSVTTTLTKPNGGSALWCSTEWECTDWSECTNKIQTRTCSYPSDKCKPEVDKPLQAQSCETTPALEPVVNNNVAPVETPTDNPTDKPTSPSNSLTGASIAGLLGKNSWIAALAVLVIAGAAYYFVRRFSK